jgi:hypothetical protein
MYINLSFDYLPGKMTLKPKRREIWLHIGISSLGLEGKLDVYKASDEKSNELLMSVTIPPNNPKGPHNQ